MVLRELVQQIIFIFNSLKIKSHRLNTEKKSTRHSLGVKILLGLYILRGENGVIKERCRHSSCPCQNYSRTSVSCKIIMLSPDTCFCRYGAATLSFQTL